MNRIEVVDAENHNRLLGTLPRGMFTETLDRYRVAMKPRMPLIPFSDPLLAYSYLCELDVRTAEFARKTRYSERGWKADVVLATDAGIEDLMTIDEFRLPYESYDEARYRRRFR